MILVMSLIDLRGSIHVSINGFTLNLLVQLIQDENHFLLECTPILNLSLWCNNIITNFNGMENPTLVYKKINI